MSAPVQLKRSPSPASRPTSSRTGRLGTETGKGTARGRGRGTGKQSQNTDSDHSGADWCPTAVILKEPAQSLPRERISD
jgi:hypothetical protein